MQSQKDLKSLFSIMQNIQNHNNNVLEQIKVS